MDKSPISFPSRDRVLPPGARLAMLVGDKLASQIMSEINASGHNPRVIKKWQDRILGSPYSYCFNNPINYFDPDGRWGLAHFFMTWVQEFTHQVIQAFKEIGTGAWDVVAGVATWDWSRVGHGFEKLGTGTVRLAFSPIEATGTAFFAVMPDLENALGFGPGNEAGAHGGEYKYEEYTEGLQNERRNAKWYEFGRRWSSKGHLAHTSQDAHIHRESWSGTWKEGLLETLDLSPAIWIPGFFITGSSYEETVYGN